MRETFFDALTRRLAEAGYRADALGIHRSGREGYWSNLDKDENQSLQKLLAARSPREAIRQRYPEYEGIIFSPKREAALELLDIRPGELCIDYGCMWGALAVGMAKRGGCVLAVDQTYDSLAFLEHRRRSEEPGAMILAQDDIRKVDLPGLADCALVYGVLEWIPEVGEIELKKFYGKRAERTAPPASPEALQSDFLKRVLRNLKDGGRLLLAIENRYDLSQFLGKRDPHSNLWLTSFLPRRLADWVSRLALGRPYVNYLYSFRKLERLLRDAGFADVALYMAFPDYRFPELILPYERGLDRFRAYDVSNLGWKGRAAKKLEWAFMRYGRGRFFAPSIIAAAAKPGSASPRQGAKAIIRNSSDGSGILVGEDRDGHGHCRSIFKASSLPAGIRKLKTELAGYGWYNQARNRKIVVSGTDLGGYFRLEIERLPGTTPPYLDVFLPNREAISRALAHYCEIWGAQRRTGLLAPVHGDLTLDKIILDGDSVAFIDWEHFRADALPIGFDAAYLLFESLHREVEKHGAPDQESLRLIAGQLARLRRTGCLDPAFQKDPLHFLLDAIQSHRDIWEGTVCELENKLPMLRWSAAEVRRIDAAVREANLL